MKHKITIYKANALWYAVCPCRPYNTGIMTMDPITHRFGRPTWEQAFAMGIAHQQNANGRGESE